MTSVYTADSGLSMTGLIRMLRKIIHLYMCEWKRMAAKNITKTKQCQK